MPDFLQRFRLVHHAREKRVKERGCRDFRPAQPDIDSDLADRLGEQDLTLLRAARNEGRSHAIACVPAWRHDGKLICREECAEAARIAWSGGRYKLARSAMSSVSAPGPIGERQEHLDAVVSFAGAGQRIRLCRGRVAGRVPLPGQHAIDVLKK